MILMFHDDDCGELLDNDGRCQKCEFQPDEQSTAFHEVSEDELRTLRAARATSTARSYPRSVPWRPFGRRFGPRE